LDILDGIHFGQFAAFTLVVLLLGKKVKVALCAGLLCAVTLQCSPLTPWSLNLEMRCVCKGGIFCDWHTPWMSMSEGPYNDTVNEDSSAKDQQGNGKIIQRIDCQT
jgi:hypothetical protein